MSGGLFQIFIYLLAAVVSVPVARRPGLGSVLGCLLAGALIGPSAPGWVVAAVPTVIAGGRHALRPLFRRVAGTGLREMFTATALGLVVGIALLMQSVGISAAPGTFIAGVVLADSEYRHQLGADVEPFLFKADGAQGDAGRGWTGPARVPSGDGDGLGERG